MNYNTLHLIADHDCNGYNFEFLNVLFLASILTGIFVIIIKNPVISILFLICLFLSIAVYLMLLGMQFIGLSYLLVYIGAVSILFLFILMLINIRISELQSETNNSLPLALIAGLSFYYILYNIMPVSIYDILFINTYYDILTNIYKINLIDNTSSVINGKLSFVTSGIWDKVMTESSHITSIGNILYTSHFLWLIITSIILLLAMVGTIIITIKS